jgi:superfamily II DNA or RNA helicase
MMQEREYQTEAACAINKEWETVNRTLLVQATGTGKTIIFCRIASEQVGKSKRGLILAHRGELLDQAAHKMELATGLKCAVEKAERSCLEPPDCFYRIVVGSVQSMMQEKRLEQFEHDYFDFIIIDEAHHALSDSYQRIMKHFPAAKVLGVTATPDRADMQNLGEYFESLAYEYPLVRAIKEGYLCKIKALTVPLKIDLNSVAVQRGDFKVADLANALDPYLAQIAKEIAIHCEGRKTIIFLPLIATSQKMNGFLLDEGLRSVEVNGKTINRDERRAGFEGGHYDIMCNSMLYTEGYDCPDIDCVVCLRPTKLRSFYVQMIGRGTRIHPGKDHLLILDFLWHTDRHELCHPAHLISKNDKTAKKMTKILEELNDEAYGLEEVEQEANIDTINEREMHLAEVLKNLQRRKQKLVDPLQFELSIQSEDLSSYVPTFGWEFKPASDKQKAALEGQGIEPGNIECAGKASKILKRLSKRRFAGLSTPKQIRFLERKGFDHVGTWEFQEAKTLIQRIANNDWKIPHGIIPDEYNPNKHNLDWNNVPTENWL